MVSDLISTFLVICGEGGGGCGALEHLKSIKLNNIKTEWFLELILDNILTLKF